ncbi:putative RDD family membrane protein YckC [Bacillus tianshenii]|uniref:RDD family membrane protein YckC n=1 Tax=Sutcliffiella tianshenii TaxID=1463404 RepID=A0ABS2NWY3_9BACI|nr:RDD family protein [Bacillus tianshenii]MBM7619182.1 putative RDD family membrane protein YckC [Bacillus tianshenii]
MNAEQLDIKTPEYVSLQFQSAGLGSRAAAFIIDQIILLIVNILIIIGLLFMINGTFMDFFSADMPSYLIAGAIILIFIIRWAYFFAFEYFSGGSTLGKKMVGIRVIQENGHSITLLSSLLRNLLRIIDSLPMNYLVGMLMIFFHSKHKRLGDLVAGTIVVHERRKKKMKLTPIEKEIQKRGLSRENLVLNDYDLRRFNEKDWKLMKTYSNRFLQLSVDDRILLTRQVAEIVSPKLGMPVEDKGYEELENLLLVLYLLLKDEWEFEL